MTPAATATNPTRTTLLLGVATVVAQSVLLREAMAAMGGSETAWGLVMALWLAGMGAGSRAGIRIGSRRLANGLPVAVLALAGIGAVLLRAAPAILGAAPGEALTTWRAVWLWASAVVPTAAAGGLAFPILAGELGTDGPGRAYTIEAVGALTGGLAFSFVLAPFGTAATLLVATGIVAGTLIGRDRPILAASLVLGCAFAAVPAGPALSRADWRWAARPGSLGSSAETRHQRLEISTGPPFNLYADGRLAATYPDRFTTLPRAHLMMLLHPEPHRVLVAGCAAGGGIEAMVRHPFDRLIMVEEDPGLQPLLAQWYGPDYRRLLEGPRVVSMAADPITVVKRERGLDLVILADGDPSTLRANRTRTLEFFRMCRTAMAVDGVIVLETRVRDTFLGGDSGRLLATLFSTLHHVFPNVIAVPGERVLLVAGNSGSELTIAADGLARRLARRPAAEEVFPPEMLELLVDPSRQAALSRFLETTTEPANTIAHPRAVSLAAALHEIRSGSRLAQATVDRGPSGSRSLEWIVIAAVAALLFAAAAAPAPMRAVAAAWTVGVMSMGWWLLLLSTWQATRGSVYAEVGILTALFMGGVAAGSRAGLRVRSPRHALSSYLAGGAGLSLILAFGWPAHAPLVVVPMLLLTGGALTGAAFPALSSVTGEGSARLGAGRAFAADEIGAATAALIIGTAAIPWAGMTATAAALAMLGAAAIPAALRR